MDDPADVETRFGLGLARNVQRLVPHNPLWATAFEGEVARFQPALAPVALAVEHYGSSAVPGLAAKPIIDIQVGVARIEDALELIAPMAALGYDDAGSQGIPDHRIFGRGVRRTFLVHIVPFGSEQWWRGLRFRDRLRADAALRAEYQQLKEALIASTATRAAYTAGKAAFVARVSA